MMDRDASIEEQYRRFVDSINRATDREIEENEQRRKQVAQKPVRAALAKGDER